MGRFSGAAVLAGMALLLAAGAVFLFSPGLGWLRWALLAAGVALLLASAVLGWQGVRPVLGRRSTRYGAGAALVILLALGVAVLANAVSMRHSARWDLTENRRHSLSPQTIKIVQGLEEPVTAIAFFRSDTPGKRTAEDLLKQYASYAGGKFTYRMEDPDRAPGLARRYGVETYGTVVLERGDKSEKVQDAEEEKLTSGLLKVTRAGKPVIYVLTGHGEADLQSAERAGLSEARTQLEKANYEVKPLALARDPKVPDDAAVLIVAGPRTDLFPQELEAIDAYVARGGKVLFMVAPFQAEGLRTYLAKYGIEVGDDLVVELNPVGRLFGVGPEVPVVTQYGSHPITRDLAGVMTLFPLTRSVEPAKTPPAGISVQTLAETSAQSWGETDRAALQKGEAKPDPQDRKGPVPVAVVATIEAKTPAGDAKAPASEPKAPAAAAASEAKKPARARLVVLGTANLPANQFLGAQGNRDFFLNAVSWLADEEDQVSLRARDNKQSPVILTSAQSQLVFWLPVVVLPAAIAALGIGILWNRRRSS
ncbi:MAG: GldG family protein [Candidatus Rokubacteria bacterium]|nr:GldG family protein [Candidatus Rokubacteria bacterium]